MGEKPTGTAQETDDEDAAAIKAPGPTKGAGERAEATINLTRANIKNG